MFTRILNNTSWLFFDRTIRLILGLAVSVWVARYLGPDRFGILRYAVSLIAFVGSFIYLGLSGLVVREVVNRPESRNTIIGTTFFIKMAGAVVAYATVIAFAFIYGDKGIQETWVLLFVGLQMLFRPLESIDYWFQAKVQSKYIVIAKDVGLFSGSALKVLLILLNAGLVWFAVVSSLEIILGLGILVLNYIRNGETPFAWQFCFKEAKFLLSQSWMLLVSSFFAQVYMKVDQIMLRTMIGPREVGLYSVAVNFSEVWYFIPSAIALSAYPMLIEQKKKSPELYRKSLQKTFDALFVLSVSVVIPVALLARPVVQLLYGSDYMGSAPILIVHVWAGIFIFMRELYLKWTLIENYLPMTIITHGAGAVLNYLLNLILIPGYGGLGAAYATLIAYATASYFVLFIPQQTRSLAVMITRSYLLPIRLITRLPRLIGRMLG